ncbi:MAG: alginate export family protein [Planctomycetota bacterium]
MIAALLLLQEPTAEPAERPTPPSISLLRFPEDYSGIEGTTAADDWWSDWKDIPLGRDGDWRASFGIELRAQGEAYTGDGLGTEEEQLEYIWWRALPVAEVRNGGFRAFVQGILAYETGLQVEPAPIDVDRGDFLQAFAEATVDLEGAEWRTRFGRQLVLLGTGRLVSIRYGPNVLQTFDGVRSRYGNDDWSVEALWMRPVEVEEGAFDDEANSEEVLYGLYSTVDLGPSNLDLYWLGHEDDEVTYDSGTADIQRQTLGARVHGRRGNLDWNWEAFYQFGDFGSQDIQAWSLAADTGYRFESLPFEPRAFLRTAIISGDDDPTDGTLETFDPLFPRGKYFGEIGIIGPANLINAHLGLQADVGEQWAVESNLIAYWRESTDDGVYNNPVQVLRPGNLSDARYIGTQFDILAEWSPDRNWAVGGAYSFLAPGEFVEETGEDGVVQFFQLYTRFWF